MLRQNNIIRSLFKKNLYPHPGELTVPLEHICNILASKTKDTTKTNPERPVHE